MLPLRRFYAHTKHPHPSLPDPPRLFHRVEANTIHLTAASREPIPKANAEHISYRRNTLRRQTHNVRVTKYQHEPVGLDAIT